MSRDIKAHLFRVTPVKEKAYTVRAAVEAFAKAIKPLEFEHAGHDYLATDLIWNASKAVLTGTVFRVRSSGLPAEIHGTQAKPLSIDPSTNLGEPMCFALQPDPGAALIHYSHTGARHSVLPAMLSKMGYAHAMQVEPVIKTDMLEKLQSKKFFKALEFSLTDPKGVQDLRAMGGSVERALGMLDDTGGVNIRVEITMGHTKGEGLVANATKTLAKRLAKIGMEAGDDSSPVRTVKVRGSDGEDAPMEELDLLNAREVIKMQVDEADRSIDRGDCQKKLAKLLEDHKDTFKTQAGNP